jgi:membrane protein involved in colicin uptake
MTNKEQAKAEAEAKAKAEAEAKAEADSLRICLITLWIASSAIQVTTKYGDSSLRPE